MIYESRISGKSPDNNVTISCMTTVFFSELPSPVIIRRIVHVMLKGSKAFHILQKLDIYFIGMMYGQIDITTKKACRAFFIVIYKKEDFRKLGAVLTA